MSLAPSYAEMDAYCRALEEEINVCQAILTEDFNHLIDPTMVLAALESLLTLIQEGFYINQYIYSTHSLSADQPLRQIWEVYNALPQQLRAYVQNFTILCRVGKG